MEVSVKLPNNLYQNVSERARVERKSVGEIIKNAVRRSFSEGSIDLAEQTEILKQSIRFCSDEEILELANLQTPDDRRLSDLFEKNRENVLTKKERSELSRAVEVSQINDLRKALGIVEAKKRKLI